MTRLIVRFPDGTEQERNSHHSYTHAAAFQSPDWKTKELTWWCSFHGSEKAAESKVRSVMNKGISEIVNGIVLPVEIGGTK